MGVLELRLIQMRRHRLPSLFGCAQQQQPSNAMSYDYKGIVSGPRTPFRLDTHC